MSTTRTVITFTDGRTYAVPAEWTDPTGGHVVGLDANGEAVAFESYGNGKGMHYTLTDCCGASFTGSMGEICCRNCYGVVWTQVSGGMPIEPVTPRA